MAEFTIAACPLCGGPDVQPFQADRRRHYVRCSRCDIVCVPPAEHLPVSEERARYSRHENTATHDGYVKFLHEVVEVVCALPCNEPTILDFGSGEHRVLEGLFGERNIACAGYDPLYGIGIDALETTYDVVVACEVIEHFREPRVELERIVNLVRPGGWFVVRTRVRPGDEEFRTWWYKEDPTHLGFYSVNTLEWVAGLFGTVEERWDDKGIWVIRSR